MNRAKLAETLGLTEEEIEVLGLQSTDLQEDADKSGETSYSYYFTVPETTPQRILGKKGWSIGDRVDVDPALFREPDRE
ncbi:MULTISPECIES: hypothetical protein [Erwinia]|uniref:hypothetical protein n=1 Tax=Erwinia TaxID=551 RepID=UPI00055314E4|nr:MULTISPECIES: hypothetical protein [Erwinia]